MANSFSFLPLPFDFLLSTMINEKEFRKGNYLLQKVNGRIINTRYSLLHDELLVRDGGKDLYPIVLKAQVLEQCGFTENKDYPLLPQAREFRMVLAVPGSQKSEIVAHIKNNGECFGRYVVEGHPASANFYQLHQLQNLYFALTGTELEVNLK